MAEADSTPRPEMDDQLIAWVEALRTQADGTYWSVTINGTADGTETIEILHSAEWVHKQHTAVIGGHRTPVVRKSKGQRAISVAMLYPGTSGPDGLKKPTSQRKAS